MKIDDIIDMLKDEERTPKSRFFIAIACLNQTRFEGVTLPNDRMMALYGPAKIALGFKATNNNILSYFFQTKSDLLKTSEIYYQNRSELTNRSIEDIAAEDYATNLFNSCYYALEDSESLKIQKIDFSKQSIISWATLSYLQLTKTDIPIELKTAIDNTFKPTKSPETFTDVEQNALNKISINALPELFPEDIRIQDKKQILNLI